MCGRSSKRGALMLGHLLLVENREFNVSCVVLNGPQSRQSFKLWGLWRASCGTCLHFVALLRGLQLRTAPRRQKLSNPCLRRPRILFQSAAVALMIGMLMFVLEFHGSSLLGRSPSYHLPMGPAGPILAFQLLVARGCVARNIDKRRRLLLWYKCA